MAFNASVGCASRAIEVGSQSRAGRIVVGLCAGPTLVFPSALGWMAAVWRVDRLHRFAFGFENRGEALRATGQEKANRPGSLGPSLRSFVERMQAVAAGEVDDLRDIDVDLDDRTEFQRAVLEACRRIPRGSVRSYADLARQAGHTGSARAVGNVMATNRLPLIIPCHRVVGSGGKLGGFSAPQGLAMKVRLLEMEGARSHATRKLVGMPN